MTVAAQHLTSAEHLVSELASQECAWDPRRDRAPAEPSVPGQATALIFAFPAKPDRCKWPADKVQQLTQLWDMGLSHGAIAQVMGLGKGKVSAKLDRMGLERAKPVVDGRSFAAQPARQIPPRMEDLPGRQVTLMELTGCRAPTGERDGEHLFCDEPRQRGASYCSGHHQIAYRK